MADNNERIAVVGGGIAGLFCAHILAQRGRQVTLFEASDRLGGRIRTIRLDKDSNQLTDAWKVNELEFYAEFGPMRIELEKQPLLRALLKYLDIKSEGASNGKVYLKRFPAYSSPTSEHDPQYELRSEEVGKTPLQLLQMALLRIILHLRLNCQAPSCEDGLATRQKILTKRVTLASITGQPTEPVFSRWLRELEQRHYWEIQEWGMVEGVPLYAMGFWNLLSDYLSHDAISKLRDLGTFYHLLPENPNAAEWLVWWLVGFATTEDLQGIHGGMESITEKLSEELKTITCKKNCRVTALLKNEKGLELQLADGNSGNGEFDRVILALPRRPLEEIVIGSEHAFEPEEKIRDLLGSAFGFPMVKAFAVVRNRWWSGERRANRYATRIPTRELHYWNGLTTDRQGMVMVYTDRPASAFWANYVPPGPQDDVSDSKERRFGLIWNRLKKKILQYLNENDVTEISPEDIAWCGIRDWGRAPYGGANHAWRTERKYWVVMRRLADIRQEATGSPSIHVCGEAYSDYHGFIEGALRSAVYALHRILDKSGEQNPLGWLEKVGVEEKTLKELREWASWLDKIDGCTPFMHSW